MNQISTEEYELEGEQYTEMMLRELGELINKDPYSYRKKTYYYRKKLVFILIREFLIKIFTTFLVLVYCLFSMFVNDISYQDIRYFYNYELDEICNINGSLSIEYLITVFIILILSIFLIYNIKESLNDMDIDNKILIKHPIYKLVAKVFMDFIQPYLLFLVGSLIIKTIATKSACLQVMKFLIPIFYLPFIRMHYEAIVIIQKKLLFFDFNDEFSILLSITLFFYLYYIIVRRIIKRKLTIFILTISYILIFLVKLISNASLIGGILLMMLLLFLIEHILDLVLLLKENESLK